MSTEARTQTARRKQAEQSKIATLELLKAKRPAETTFSLYLTNEEGEQVEATMKFRAIGAKAYDKLMAKHPPKAEQRIEGAAFDIDSFAPALISAVCVEPELTEKDVKEIWDSPEWSRGDLMVLFTNAVNLNNRGIDIPFNANG